jgi:hypothetical protein
MKTDLGFNKKVDTAGYDESESLVNILKVNSWRVTRDTSEYYEFVFP